MDPKELRKFAFECLHKALSAGAEEADKLRQTAREMLDLANGTDQPATQQQQQIQPSKDEKPAES